MSFRKTSKGPFFWALKRRVLTPYQYGLISYARRTLSSGNLHVPGSERAIEVPAVMRKTYGCTRKVLEVGDVLMRSIHPDPSLVTVVDWSSNGLDILDCFLAENFSLAVSISTLEHVGMGHYGDSSRNQGDVTALQRMVDSLLPGGKIVLTVPVGSGQASHRVYDHWSLRTLLEPLKVVTKDFYRWRWPRWEESFALSAYEAPVIEGYATAVVVVEGVKP